METCGQALGLERQLHLVVVDHQLMRDFALLTPAQHVVEILAGIDDTMQISIAGGRLGKTAVIVGDEARQECIGLVYLLMRASRNSFTRRSCSVEWARSTRPFAWLVLAQRISMFSSDKARPN